MTRIIAGSWCIVEKDRIVRAALLREHRVWVAGDGELPLHPDRHRRWPVHYA